MRTKFLFLLFLLFIVAGCNDKQKSADNDQKGNVIKQQGLASWYGPGFHGKTTANGETYNQNKLTAASKTLPLGSTAKVTNVETGKSVTVKINDRGPYVGKRIIDLSKAAAKKIDLNEDGVGKVKIVAKKPDK